MVLLCILAVRGIFIIYGIYFVWGMFHTWRSGSHLCSYFQVIALFTVIIFTLVVVIHIISKMILNTTWKNQNCQCNNSQHSSGARIVSGIVSCVNGRRVWWLVSVLRIKWQLCDEGHSASSAWCSLLFGQIQSTDQSYLPLTNVCLHDGCQSQTFALKMTAAMLIIA